MDNYQLYRFTPKLSGNMMLDIVIDSGMSEKLTVTNAQLRPISRLIPYVHIPSDDILIRPHQINIKNFYNSIQSKFWDAVIDGQLKSDWFMIIPESTTDMESKYIKNWDDTYWAGSCRMSTKYYDTTHCVLIPLWLEKLSGIRFRFYLKIGGVDITSKVLTITDPDLAPNDSETYHTRFCEYMMNYFEYIGLISGCNNVIKIQYKDNLFYIHGLDVTNGNVVTLTDYTLTRNLIARERPLLEWNSMIINAFRDKKLICPNMMVFNICFNPRKLIPVSMFKLINGQSIQCYVETDILDSDGNWAELERRDIYTNHHFVPDRVYSTTTSNSYDYREPTKYNVLDYLDDYNVTSIMHKNKIVQPICFWSSVRGSEYIFNVYDGFGTRFKIGTSTSDDSDNTIKLSHVYRACSLPDAINNDVDNIAIRWCTYPDVSINEIETMLTYPTYLSSFNEINNIFHSLTSYINGLKFNYEATTLEIENIEYYITDIQLAVIKYSENELDTDTIFSWASNENITINFDYFDVIKMSITSSNTYIVIFTLSKNTDSDSYTAHVIILNTRNNENLLYQKIIKNWEQNLNEIFFTDDKILKFILDALKTLEYWETIYFDNGLQLRTDNTLKTTDVKEQVYYKKQNINRWVYRYSDNIKPALFGDTWQRSTNYYQATDSSSVDDSDMSSDSSASSSSSSVDDSDMSSDSSASSLSSSVDDSDMSSDSSASSLSSSEVLKFTNGFGRNYLWLKYKTKISELPSNFKSYIKSENLPCHPSIGYDSISTFYSENPQNLYGDFIWSEPLPVFLGYTMDGSSESGVGGWAEYKWFDMSQIGIFPENMAFDNIIILDNDKDILQNYTSILALKYINNSELDEVWLAKIYDYFYDLQRVEWIDDITSLIDYDTLNSIYETDKFNSTYIKSNYADTSTGKIRVYVYNTRMCLK